MSTRPTKEEKAQWKAEQAKRDAKAKARHDEKMAAIREKNKGNADASGAINGALGSIFGW